MLNNENDVCSKRIKTKDDIISNVFVLVDEAFFDSILKDMGKISLNGE